MVLKGKLPESNALKCSLPFLTKKFALLKLSDPAFRKIFVFSRVRIAASDALQNRQDKKD
ncbi:MAG: hypothetical protein Q8882_08830 [Bacillota bacterium]|nr:hypothetical protein [Bacillota bacterium]